VAGGRLAFDAVVDASAAGTAWRLDADLTGARLRALLEGAGAAPRADGTTAATLRLGGGAGGLRSLAGSAAFTIRDGWIEGIDLLQMLRAARAAAGRRGEGEIAKPDGRTPFRLLSASARIHGGVARSDDVRLEADEARASGSCVLDLLAATIDCLLRATTPHVPDTVLPVTVTGPLSSPRYGVAVGRLLREEAEEELRRRLRRGLERWLRRPPGG
ncbi:MAG TPA: AsmA-like C-terminal region-containing protein, partial [Vicinamibacterales bacterium]|nr:AsmA-like C-terminal region-containing protein [Vicinamibacterales bacterium]